VNHRCHCEVTAKKVIWDKTLSLISNLLVPVLWATTSPRPRSPFLSLKLSLWLPQLSGLGRTVAEVTPPRTHWSQICETNQRGGSISPKTTKFSLTTEVGSQNDETSDLRKSGKKGRKGAGLNPWVYTDAYNPWGLWPLWRAADSVAHRWKSVYVGKNCSGVKVIRRAQDPPLAARPILGWHLPRSRHAGAARQQGELVWRGVNSITFPKPGGYCLNRPRVQSWDVIMSNLCD